MKLWDKLSLLGVSEKASCETERKKIYLNRKKDPNFLKFQ